MKRLLYIGQKNYSSWSLRPWLAMRWALLDFEERFVSLAQPGYGRASVAEILALSPNGQLPVLHAGDLVVWDSLAICEWVAEQEPGLWPASARVRAQARAVTAEMHSGFAGLRRDLSMNIRRRCPPQDWPEDTERNIARMQSLVGDCRRLHGAQGPWLFGQRSIADAFLTPVATRMRSYSVPLQPDSQAYFDTLLDDADFRDWEAACEADSWDQHGYSVIDGLYR